MAGTRINYIIEDNNDDDDDNNNNNNSFKFMFINVPIDYPYDQL